MYILVVTYFMKPSLLTDPCQRTSTTTTRWSTSIDSKVASAVVTELQLNPASSHRRRRRTSRLSDSCANRNTTWRGGNSVDSRTKVHTQNTSKVKHELQINHQMLAYKQCVCACVCAHTHACLCVHTRTHVCVC